VVFSEHAPSLSEVV